MIPQYEDIMFFIYLFTLNFLTNTIINYSITKLNAFPSLVIRYLTFIVSLYIGYKLGLGLPCPESLVRVYFQALALGIALNHWLADRLITYLTELSVSLRQYSPSVSYFIELKHLLQAIILLILPIILLPIISEL